MNLKFNVIEDRHPSDSDVSSEYSACWLSGLAVLI